MLKQTLPNREFSKSTHLSKSGRVLFGVRASNRLRFSLGAGLLVLVALAAVAFGTWVKPEIATAAAANTVNFQARLETASGSIASDGDYNVRFKLYNAPTGGTPLWTETYLVNSVQGIRTANGYLVANLGSLTAFPSSIDWGQQLYLTMEIGGTGTTVAWDGEMSPRLSLTSVPSAFALNSYNGANGYSSSLSILQPTGGNQKFQIQDQGAAGTYNLCVIGSASCGFVPETGGTGYIQNQNASAQAASNFWISGTGKAATALQAPLLDSIIAGTLGVGTTNATAITIGKVGVTTTFPGSVVAAGLVAGSLTVGQTTNQQVTVSAGAGDHALEIGRTDGVASTPFIDLHSGSTAVDYDARIVASGGSGVTGGGTLSLNAANINVSGNFQVAGTTVITAARVLQNVTTDASILTTGTVGSARISGSYTGITAVGTLASLTTSGVITSTVSTGTAPLTVSSTTKVTNLNADLLDGLDSSAFCQGSCLAGGSASGDLTGTYPNPTIAKLQGSTLTITTPVSGNILQFNGTAWVNQAVTGDISISSTGVAAIATGSIVNGDLSTGSFANITGVGTLGSLSVTNDVSIISGGLVVNGNTVVSNGRVLQNVTYNGGTIAVGYGGTGQTSFTQYGVLFGNNTGALGVTSAGATGQCLVATSGGAPAWSTCAGTGSGVTLQAAYNNSLGGTTPEIVLDSSRTTLDVQAYSGQTADLLALRAYSAIGLGVLRFGVAADGSVTAASGLTIQSGGANITGSVTATSTLQGSQLISTVTTGTAPLTVASTTVVANLNADLLDGYHAADFVMGSGSGYYIQNGTSLQASANFNIDGTGSAANLNASTALQTAGTTRVDASGNLTNIGTYSGSGDALITTSSTAALRLQDASSNVLFNADTTNMRLSVGNVTGSAARLHVEGSMAPWTSRVASDTNIWTAVTYGNGTFVAVAQSGTNRVMTSPDGITWTARAAAEANSWMSVTYGNGTFVAVAQSGTNRVMTSPDGITWTARAATQANQWRSITYGEGLFVAVSFDGTNRVMTSPDGITWTARTHAGGNAWLAVNHGDNQFVAVGNSGGVMTSPDGITWTARTAAEANTWDAVTYGNGTFVALAQSGTNRVMTSPDGITWTARTASVVTVWQSVGYANGLFVAVANTGVMTSPDGITWTTGTAPEANSWTGITYGNGLFVAVANSGTNRVMTSPGYSEVAERINGDLEVNGVTRLSGNTTLSGSTQLSGDTVVHTGSATAFQIQDSSANSLLNANTLSMRLSVGNATGSNARLHIEGSMAAWTPRTAGQANQWNSVTYGNGLFVAVAISGTSRVQTSTNGTTWIPRTAAEANLWQSVTFGNGLFVAVSTDGTNRVMTSPDGITWTPRTAAEANLWQSVTFGNGLFVAVANSGTNRVMTSPDGITWTARAPASTNSWQSVTYGNGLFVAVSQNGTNRVMTSPDGITWTARTEAEANTWTGVTYGNGLFVAVSSDGTNRVMTSPDGITWTARTQAEANLWQSVTFGNGLFVAVANSGTNRVMTSPDGITWTARTAEATTWTSATYGNGLFVAVANGGTNRVMTSPGYSEVAERINGDLEVNGSTHLSGDMTVYGNTQLKGGTTIQAASANTFSIQNAYGSSLLNADTINMRLSVGNAAGTAARLYVEASMAPWIPRTAAEANSWTSITHGNGIYVAVASSGTNRVMTSPDGITWTARAAAEANWWNEVTYGNGLFVAVSANGTNRAMTSPDGITWTPRSAEASSWASVTYANGLFVAVAYSGTNRVMTSPDGITWTPRTAAEANSWASVTYANGLFVAVSSDGTNRVMTSPDGITWTPRTAATQQQWRSVVYAEGLFVAVADNGIYRVMTSPDGITWTARSAAVNTSWFSVTYGKGLFVAVAQSNDRVMTSPDGVNWTTRAVPEANSWSSVTYADGLFVAVAASGTNRVMTNAGYIEPAQRVNGDVEVNGSFELNGAATIKETSIVAFQIQNSAGDVLLNADTLNNQVGVKGALVVGDAPITYALHVATTPQLSAGYSPLSSAIGGSSSPSFTELADFNNDGLQDAAVADSGNGQITIYLGSGSTLTSGYVLTAPVSSMASTFAVADVDADGDQDIVVGDYGNNRIAVYKNNGNMTFAAAVFYPAAGGPRSLALADVDADGDKDVAATTYGGAILVLKNSGTGTFGAAVSYTGIAQATQVILRDFDGDSDQDLFVASQYYDGSYHTYALLKNYGDGTFATKTETAIANLYPTEARATDIDNDGDQDVVISSANGNGYPEIYVLKNNGSGVFTSTGYGAMGSSGQSHMSLSDLDGDGDQDVLATYRWDGLPSTQINAYYNNGSGAYSSIVSLVPSTSAWMSTATGLDITGDGKTDFFYLNKTTSTYMQFNYTGAPTTIMTSSGSGSYVKSYDINKDGAQDIVTVSGGNITVRLYTGPGTYSSTTVANSMGSLTSMDFADFDSDGDIDIISTYSSQLSVVKNNGDGTFTAGVTYNIGASDARNLSLGDMDGDGDVDAVVAAFGNDSVSVMLNNGSGGFTSLGLYATGDGPLSVALADFDKDGNLDVVVTCFNSAGGIASTLRNTGTGALAAKVDLSPGPGSANSVVATGDYNGDGDKDILLLSRFSNALVVYHNNGTGTFSISSSYTTMTAPLSMDVQDIDGDGDKDVVIGYTSNISVMRNNGSANFGTRSDYLPGGGVTSYPLQPVIADIDGDGDKDILTSTVYTGSTGNLVAYMNAAGGPSSSPQSTGTLSVTAQSATSGGVFIQGAVGQTANLFLVQDASGNALMALDAQGNLTVSGSILGGIGSPDYAENITISDPTIEAADVVAMDPANTESVIKSSTPYDKAAVGVISTSPGFVTNTSKVDAPDETQRPLALSGRVPVKVTTESGVIAEGDYLTTSSTPGYAMKATKEGHVIGRAMGSFTGTEENATNCNASYACGKVLMFIDNSYYSPVDGNNLQANDMTLFGNLGVGGNAVIGGGLGIAQNLNVGGLATLEGLKVTGNASVNGDLTVVGTTNVATLKVGKHILSNSDAPLVAVGSAAGQDGLVTVDGTDVAGTLSITVKARPQQGNTPAEVLNAGTLADVTFLSPYEYTPRIVISPTSQASIGAPVYLVKTNTGWQLMTSQPAADGTQYQFDYVIIGSSGQAATTGQ